MTPDQVDANHNPAQNLVEITPCPVCLGRLTRQRAMLENLWATGFKTDNAVDMHDAIELAELQGNLPWMQRKVAELIDKWK